MSKIKIYHGSNVAVPNPKILINGYYNDSGVMVMKEQVYEYLRTIPQGKVVTYGQIAEYLGNKSLARVVGNILHNNPDENKYPCYKVVDSRGNLSRNYAFGGIDKQKEKLEAEGIVVDNYRVNLEIYNM